MQSRQETILEEFMQRSFGAQFLFVPKKYRKGSAQREPADLAWVSGDFVALFYLTSSKENLTAQIEHNRKQAIGYHRFWATNKTDYALRGRNRFGDECYVPFKSVINILTLLVVSHECGIHLQQPISSIRSNAVLVLPEALIHWIANFGGTIVDLLYIAESYIRNDQNDQKHMQLAFAELESQVIFYTTEAFSKADPEKRYLLGIAQYDYIFILEHLSRMRLPRNFGRAIQDRKGRELIGGLFGDLMLIEYASLAIVSEMAIQASEPPQFKKWVILKIKGVYYSFVVGTVHMGSNNALEATNAALDACKNESGEVDCIYVQYGNVMNANDYRVPLLFSVPPRLPRRHSAVLAEKIINLSSVKFLDTNRNSAT